jgi:hypothetical protein
MIFKYQRFQLLYSIKPLSFLLLLTVIGTGWFIASPVLWYESRSQLMTEINPEKLIHFQEEDSYSTKIAKTSVRQTNDDVIIQRSKLETNETPGDTRLFWTWNVKNDDYEKINATLKAIGPHVLIYLANQATLSVFESTLLDINDSFEDTIYLSLTKFFGFPLDIDENGKIIILILDIIHPFGGTQYVAGFFNPLDQWRNIDLNPAQRHSNEAEILYIDGDQGAATLNAGEYEVIAHELQHLIHYGNDDDETVWLEEGASMFAEYLIGLDPFRTNTYKSAFTSNPDVSLTYWDYFDSQSLVLANYGAAYAFFLYLAEKYGGSSIIQDVTSNIANGIQSVEQALAAQGYSGNFKEVFRNWTIANFVDNTSIGNGTYGYFNTSLAMAIEYTYTSAILSRTENAVPFWGTDYLKFDMSSTIPFDFEFQGELTAGFLVTAILMNTTTNPKNIEVIPIPISADGIGNFSTQALGISADQIVIAVSSYTKSVTPSFDDEDPAPSQTYWYMVNPGKLRISPGNWNITNNSEILDLWNITVTDESGVNWKEADGAIYEIFSESGSYVGISGDLTFNSDFEYWEAISIDISDLSEGNYTVGYYLFNSTSSGFGKSSVITIVHDSISTTTTTTTTTSPLLIPINLEMLVTVGIFIVVIVVLALGNLLFGRKK